MDVSPEWELTRFLEASQELETLINSVQAFRGDSHPHLDTAEDGILKILSESESLEPLFREFSGKILDVLMLSGYFPGKFISGAFAGDSWHELALKIATDFPHFVRRRFMPISDDEARLTALRVAILEFPTFDADSVRDGIKWERSLVIDAIGDSGVKERKAPELPIVDVKRLTVTFKGESHDVSSEQALRWLKVLTDNHGEFIAGKSLVQYDDSLQSVRTNQLKAFLPRAVLELIESRTGAGSRIRAQG